MGSCCCNRGHAHFAERLAYPMGAWTRDSLAMSPKLLGGVMHIASCRAWHKPYMLVVRSWAGRHVTMCTAWEGRSRGETRSARTYRTNGEAFTSAFSVQPRMRLTMQWAFAMLAHRCRSCELVRTSEHICGQGGMLGAASSSHKSCPMRNACSLHHVCTAGVWAPRECYCT